MSAPKLLAGSLVEQPRQHPKSALRWVVTDILTGTPLQWLNDCVQATTPLRHTIGAYDSANVTLWLSAAPDGWENLLEPLTTVWHAYRADNPDVILWSGTIAVTPAQAGDGNIDLSLSTIEYYLDRRIIDVTYKVTGRGQNLIVSDLIEAYVNTATRTGTAVIDGVTTHGYTLTGVPIAVHTDGDGTARDRKYDATDRATVYTRLQELSAVNGGPEWTISWAWDSGRLKPTMYVSDRLGSAPPAGRSPAALFRLPGNLATAKYVRSYSDGDGANSVWAAGSGQGKKTPISDRYLTADMSGRPTVDLAIQPSTSITKKTVLDAHAARTLATSSHGSDSLTMSASLSSDATPVYGKDLHLGDDVYYRLGGWNAIGVDLVPEMPGGLHGTARVLAAEIDPSGELLSPIVVLHGSARRINTGSRTVIDGNGGEPRFILGPLPGGLIDGRH